MSHGTRSVGSPSSLCSSLASCTRDWIPSFAKTARRWVAMVLVDTPSSAAADLLVWPDPMSVATRRSASVSDGQPVAALAEACDHLALRAPASRIARWTSARNPEAPIW